MQCLKNSVFFLFVLTITVHSQNNFVADQSVCTITSLARNGGTKCFVYAPSEDGENQYPVLYILHGADGSWRNWSLEVQSMLRQLAQEHHLIIITPDAGKNSWYLDSPIITENQIETYLIKELIPEIEHINQANGTRGLMGISMGGHGALVLSMRNPGLFNSVSSISGVTDLTLYQTKLHLIQLLGSYEKFPQRWEDHSAYQLLEKIEPGTSLSPIYISCGTEDLRISMNREFVSLLEAMDLNYKFKAEKGDHNWQYWNSELPKHIEWHAQNLHSSDSR